MEVSKARNDTILGRLRTLVSCIFVFLGSFLVTYMIESYTNPVGDTNAADFGDTTFEEGLDGLIVTVNNSDANGASVNVKTNAVSGYTLLVNSADGKPSTVKATDKASLSDNEVKINFNTSATTTDSSINTVLITTVTNSVGE